MFRIVNKRPSEQRHSCWCNEDCDYTDSGDTLVYDDEGYCLNEYVPDGSLPATVWDEMIARL